MIRVLVAGTDAAVGSALVDLLASDPTLDVRAPALDEATLLDRAAGADRSAVKGDRQLDLLALVHDVAGS